MVEAEVLQKNRGATATLLLDGDNDVEMMSKTIDFDASNERRRVLAYLRRILKASKQLARVHGEDMMMTENNSDDGHEIENHATNETGDEIVHEIARQLLAACHLRVITNANLENLPAQIFIQGKHDIMVNDDDDDDDNSDDFLAAKVEIGKKPYQHRRVDYLRRLLRAMAPFAMDVAATVCATVVRNINTTATADNISSNVKICSRDISEASFVLFSVWLPVAPHITPLVSGLFSLPSFGCPIPRRQEELDANSVSSSHFHLLEAANHICSHYRKRRDHRTLLLWWNWSSIFSWFCKRHNGHGDSMVIENDSNAENIFQNTEDYSYSFEKASKWHAVRIAAAVLNLSPVSTADYWKEYNVQDVQVPWVIHPWELDQEEFTFQKLFETGHTQIWHKDDKSICLPSACEIRYVVSLHPYLVDISPGIVFVKHGAITRSGDTTCTSMKIQDKGSTLQRASLVRTPTTNSNLSLLGTAMCIDPDPCPILVCGPAGSGKSSLVRELARLFESHVRDNDHPLLEIHVDEETDTKTLVGSYTTTDIPGEFKWQAGALTSAVREGKWVLLEDVDMVPIEIQAALVQLLKERLLPLGNGVVEKCHPNFRLFGTMTTTGSAKHVSSGRRILHPHLWASCQVKPLPYSELKQIALGLHSDLPTMIAGMALAAFRALDKSGRQSDQNEQKEGVEKNEHHIIFEPVTSRWTGRYPSVRDLFKLLSRIANGIIFERDATFATESQRTLCLAETMDVFVSACPESDLRREFLRTVAAPIWGITPDLAFSYIERRQPTCCRHSQFTEVGRAKIPLALNSISHRTQPGQTFAQTNHALRLMESIAICIRENEPALLVGETGCGKTTLLQELARMSGRELVVQNLSLQTDSTDLLGGYRPLEMHHVARRVYQEFVDLFVSTFSRKQNAEFLGYASSVLKKCQWKRLSQCFCRAAKQGLSKVKAGPALEPSALADWERFSASAEHFEKQRQACDSGLAFVFTVGALVDAIRRGKWVLLDEINLASSETLQRLCGLLDDSKSSLTLTERGDSVAIERHPDFRLFAAMNPATDSGKKDLNVSIRSRFTEMYVDELLDPVELRVVSSRYMKGIVPENGGQLEHTDTIISVVDLYLKCRELAETVLVDGSGQKPRYTLRTLTRALTAARSLVLEQKLPLIRALFEGCGLAFQGPLDSDSRKSINRVIEKAFGDGMKISDIDHPGRRPGGRNGGDEFVLIKPFWIKTGLVDPVDWSEQVYQGRSRFILTPTTTQNLRGLVRAVASGPWPVLLEGPTSAGKTTLIEYLAARCGHDIVRINNHEHTDVQEYTGAFTADANGSLSFQDGILVQALRRGQWVILDELNLAPSEVLEALNRLLDDNRELFLPETGETVTPHPNFRLFATQNPSGAYGGRKPLSRAFRNRFIELHVGDIPSPEMVTILEKRSGCPRSHAKILVSIMDSLRRRRSKSGVFLGKDGFITPRDLLRWAGRGASTKVELAREGYMLLAERLRTDEEKLCVKEEIEKRLKVCVDLETFYYSDESEGRVFMEGLRSVSDKLSSVAPTKSLLRLVTLVLRCIKQREPVLLVGDTGCGKTTVVQLLSELLHSKLHIVNCHATTETSDLLGGLRPVRGRTLMGQRLLQKLRTLVSQWPHKDVLSSLHIPEFIRDQPTQNQLLRGGATESQELVTALPEESISSIVSLVKSLRQLKSKVPYPAIEAFERTNKRQKLESGMVVDDEKGNLVDFEAKLDEIEALLRRYNALFEWMDGPLVTAMKDGDMILLDEMSLADDAVLERMNSVLEPSRTLVLAEKGTVEDAESSFIVGHKDFQLFATMNPGGDFGKRELSPALRSRFTEIWVPPVTDQADIGLVLERSLLAAKLENSLCVVKQGMLDYVNWFNDSVCTDPSMTFADLSLSLRDILTWARFIVAVLKVNTEIGLWDAFYHGTRLMHLDGLGLGTGIAISDVNTTRQRAETFVLGLIPSHCRPCNFHCHEKFTLEDFRFGVAPFWIPRGSHQILDPQFNLEAPTTAVNILRVLRAMQLQKPVLLEGSPGVGKTSLIGALAAASGHNLVRINLSEQSDMSDLFGSDLPVPENSSSGTDRPAFKWCDGVLLSAIKAGDWVLLDELNLAPQTVLEGLNSCLDHRSSVYIPELGRTFDCPSTFRVFAAQNPLAQGGGRKGLPKSFLNRFTKVFIESLSETDLRSIVRSRFPSLSHNILDSMIGFNDQIHQNVVEKGTFGQNGSPWELNLRDIFRWAELLVSAARLSGDASSPDRFARDLYLQRFRTKEDREHTRSLYLTTFGRDLADLEATKLVVSDSDFRVGNVVLERRRSDGVVSQAGSGREPAFSLPCLSPLEAVGRCVAMNWPCLLVGRAGSGKSSIIRVLSELTNAKLVEIVLSPSSDVSELLGCFEQTDQVDVFRSTLRVIHDIALDYLVSCPHQNVERISEVLIGLVGSADSSHGILETGIDLAFELASLLAEALETQDLGVARGHVIEHVLKTLKSLRSAEQNTQGRFVWKDGALVQAMTHGHWLYLKNANLCPSSVLDRLNPVMEPGGSLLLSECGVEDSSQSRQLKCHPNFRIFLSVDPEHGEVSRAMRNRCVEISILNKPYRETPMEVVGGLDALWHEGIRSCKLGCSFLREPRGANDESNKPMEVTEADIAQVSGSLSSCLISRGLCIDSLLSSVLALQGRSPNKKSTESFLDGEIYTQTGALLPSPGLRSDWACSPQFSTMLWDARCLRLFLFSGESLLPEWDLFPSSLQTLGPGPKRELSSNKDELSSLLPGNFETGMFRNKLLALYLIKGHNVDFQDRLSLLDRLNESCTNSLRFMARSTGKLQLTVQTQKAVKTVDRTGTNGMEEGNSRDLLLFQHLPQLLREGVWLQQIKTNEKEEKLLSTLDVSFAVALGIVERSTVTCPLTPVFYPFFRSLDEWSNGLIQQCEVICAVQDSYIDSLVTFFSHRDGLWNLLSRTKFRSGALTGSLGFDETEFIVQWIWLRKKMRQLECIASSAFTDKATEQKQKMNNLIEFIDRVLFDNRGGGLPWGSSISKRATRPLVPRVAGRWESLFGLRRLASSCCLNKHRDMGSGEGLILPVDLDQLISLRHHVLFMGEKMKKDILAALCLVHLNSTNEIDQSGRNVLPVTGRDLHIVLERQLNKMEKEFSLQLKSFEVGEVTASSNNRLSVDELARAVSNSGLGQATYTSVSRKLMRDFSYIQLSPSAEFWCEQEEVGIIRSVSKIVIHALDAAEIYSATRSLSSRLKKFIDLALSRTLWVVTDLRPFQTLLWASEGSVTDGFASEKLLRCLLTTMRYNSARRSWSGSQTHFRQISRELKMSLMLFTDNTEGEEIFQGRGELPNVEERVDLHIPTATVLSLIGDEFTLSSGRSSTAFSTIGNSCVREGQCKELVRHLSLATVRNETFKPFELCAMLSDILEALFDSFPDEPRREMVSIAKRPELLSSITGIHLRTLALACTNERFRELIDPILLPLFGLLRRLWTTEQILCSSSRDYALSRIYIGLLRFHLLVPDSPLDPGQKPRAKVSLLDSRLLDTQVGLSAIRIDHGVSCGDFSPNFNLARRLLRMEEGLITKKSKQMGKIIERVQDAPPFVDVFRETRDIARSFVALDTVLNLVKLLQEKLPNKEEVRAIVQRESHWQATTSAFCDRLQSKYIAYEDVVLPLVEAISTVKAGMKALSSQIESLPTAQKDISATLNHCMMMPMGGYFQGIEQLKATLSSIDKGSTAARALAFAILGRLVLKRRLMQDDIGGVYTWCFAVDVIIGSGNMPGDRDAKDLREEDKLEEDLRDQFPDHRDEFRALLDTNKNEAGEDAMDNHNFEPIHTKQDSISSELQNEHLELLFYLHKAMFLNREDPIADRDRNLAFQLSYSAARQLYESYRDEATFSSIGEEVAPGHVMALAIVTPVSAATRVQNFGFCGSSPVGNNFKDFHRDPDPIEVTKAIGPLDHLVERLVQLLAVFPGNEILLAVGKVAEKVRRFNMLSVSVGKIMTGLEVILREAQEWEQHSSERVRLGEPLRKISLLVTSWRKLELESWSQLLHVRQERFAMQGRKHWLRLHTLLTKDSESGFPGKSISASEDLMQKTCDFAPRWIWKGMALEGERICESFLETSEDMLEVVKVLDTFVLTSPLGEFHARLSMIKNFSLQLEEECSFCDNVVRRGMAISLSTLWLYYNQFSEYLLSKLETLRKPFEKRLKEAVKLAKWDEQNYYALAESTKKNHQKLMHILKEFDEVLEMNVGVLLENELCFGIRSNAESQGEASSSIPSAGMIFPVLSNDEEKSVTTELVDKSRRILLDRNWIDATTIQTDGFVTKISQFARKMAAKLRKTEEKDSYSHASRGSILATDLCTAVFGRLESLRSDKVSRPMKERALVDLFKELKRQGYANTKWSVPAEVRRMGDILQLPAPIAFESHVTASERLLLSSTEKYYQRSLAEMTRLRGEVSTLGSRHLTPRQLNMMVGFSDHGLLMLCQQRAICSSVLSQRNKLSELIRMLALSEKVVSTGQQLLQQRMHEFQVNYISAADNLNQLSFLLASSTHLLPAGEKADWALEMVNKLDSLLGKVERGSTTVPTLVTQELADALKSKREALCNAERILRSYRQRCADLECFPIGAFDTCIVEIERALASPVCIDPCVLDGDREGDSRAQQFIDTCSQTVRCVLLTVQACTTDDENLPNADNLSMWDYHHFVAKEWASINTKRMREGFSSVLGQFKLLHDPTGIDSGKLAICAGLAGDLSVLGTFALQFVDRRINDYLTFCRVTAKFQYVVLRIFRLLISKGFCSDNATSDSEGGEGDTSGMKFEDDNEGTGMGEGEGKRDVTDEIENEDQLLGLKDEEKMDEVESEKKTPNQLDEEEAENGMEMEGDFEGEMYDVPEKNEEDGEHNEDDGEEELDREMGEDGGPNEEVIDEKMWGDSDDEEDINQSEEKFEKNSSVQGGATEDELMTAEDKEDGGKEKNDNEMSEVAKEKDQPEENEDGEAINEDFEDKYEDSHGMNVRDDEKNDEKDNEDADAMQLDDNMDIEEDSDSGGSTNGEAEQDEDGDGDGEENQPDSVTVDQPDEENVAEPDDEDEAGAHTNTSCANVEATDENPEEEDPGDDVAQDPPTENRNEIDSEPRHGLGVRAIDGKDAVQDEDEENNQEGEGEGEDEETGNGDGVVTPGNEQTGDGNSGSQQGQSLAANRSEGTGSEPLKSDEMPNPLKSPGDATKFWHRKLNMIESQQEVEDAVDMNETNRPDKDDDNKGDFEYSGQNQTSTTQALGEVEQEDAEQLEHEAPGELSPKEELEKEKTRQQQSEQLPRSTSQPKNRVDLGDSALDSTQDMDTIDEGEEEQENEIQESNKTESDDDDDDGTGDEGDADTAPIGNQVVSDLSRLNVGNNEDKSQRRRTNIVEDEQVNCISSAEMTKARACWSTIQADTYHLSRRLCEKLRLVMEPLVASKLRGDYRTGKRINMKRVIGYIASGYRKDKIWLRRTKPAKRNYRVLVAVDDSESMQKFGAGAMALRAMATLAVGMSQLEIGEVGVASFGNEMNLVHPFHLPFTAQSGVDAVRNFSFRQQRTRTALCVESAMTVLKETPGDHASMQLVFLISDGRVERDSRAELRRLIREMMEQNILLAMVVVEGGKNKKNESIVNMKEVSFENGKPIVKSFIENYPFPYYIVLDDLKSLPEVLGDALKQWFEMLARLQVSS